MELQALPADQLHHGWRQEPPKQFVPRKDRGTSVNTSLTEEFKKTLADFA